MKYGHRGASFLFVFLKLRNKRPNSQLFVAQYSAPQNLLERINNQYFMIYSIPFIELPCQLIV